MKKIYENDVHALDGARTSLRLFRELHPHAFVRQGIDEEIAAVERAIAEARAAVRSET